jgi:DNA invertase Pin-like site-specific DNA recombinase
MPRAYGYARVSSDEQKQSGLGMEAQRFAISSFMDYRRNIDPAFESGGIFQDEGVSGSIPFGQRSGGGSLLASLRSGDTIIFHKLDRAFRDLEDCLSVMNVWNHEQIAVVILNLGGAPVDTSTPFGRFMFVVLAAIAEMERGLISERTKSAIARYKANGGSMDRHAPPGFTLKGGKYHPNEELPAVLEVIRSVEATNFTVASRAHSLSRWRARNIYRRYQAHKDLYDRQGMDEALLGVV